MNLTCVFHGVFFFSSRWGVPCCLREKDLRWSVAVNKVWSVCHTNFSTEKVCLLFSYCYYKLRKHGWKLWVTAFSWNAQLPSPLRLKCVTLHAEFRTQWMHCFVLYLGGAWLAWTAANQSDGNLGNSRRCNTGFCDGRVRRFELISSDSSSQLRHCPASFCWQDMQTCLFDRLLKSQSEFHLKCVTMSYSHTRSHLCNLPLAYTMKICCLCKWRFGPREGVQVCVFCKFVCVCKNESEAGYLNLSKSLHWSLSWGYDLRSEKERFYWRVCKTIMKINVYEI